LAEQNGKALIWRLAYMLTNYATEDCRPYLQKWFEDETLDKSTRVISAWGMGKLGDRRAIEYLIQMLDDPDRQGPNFFEPGESIRAAKALCDIHNWPFNWHKSYVAKTLAKVKKSGLTKQ
jgi:HEAT repeat protein